MKPLAGQPQLPLRSRRARRRAKLLARLDPHAARTGSDEPAPTEKRPGPRSRRKKNPHQDEHQVEHQDENQEASK